MSSSQNPNDRKDNKKSTPTSDLTPGEPLWNKRDHTQKSFGQGYDWHEPVSLMKGSVESGNSLIRYGKFSFKRSMKTTGTSHGRVIDIPILRTEGSQGRFTLILRQQDSSNENGVFGNFNTFVEHGYYYCNVDVDMVSLNTQQGVSFDPATNSVRVTFESGETEKILKTIIPYRTRVKFLLPDVLRKKVTYWIEEYNNIQANRYRKPYKVTGQIVTGCGDVSTKFNGHFITRPVDSKNNNKNIKNHWVYYKVYTLPMPISWIKSNVGNPVYIDRWDKNYEFRRVNNTHRDRTMPNRLDDDTETDAPTDGYITRYDHQEKMDLVLGKSRLSVFYNRLWYTLGHACGASCSDYPLVYQGNRSYWWISNDTRITHRTWPIYAGDSASYAQGSIGGGATVVGIIGLKRQYITSALNGGYGIVLHDDISYTRTYFSGYNYSYYNSHAKTLQNNAADHKDRWEPKHIPMPYTGWERKDFPADQTITDIEGKIANDTYALNPNIHPETPLMFLGGGGGSQGHDWGGAIPYEDQSWYESQRFSGGVDLTPTSKLTTPYRGYVNGDPHVYPTPTDREFKYGDPLTRVGNLAQPMFNHYGTKETEYYQGMNQYVMSAEDPSALKFKNDFSFYGDWDNMWKFRHSGAKNARCTFWFRGWCNFRTCLFGTRPSFPRARGSSWGPVGYQAADGHLGNFTSQWINSTNNATVCAGALFTEEDAPLAHDGTQYFTGYRYDGNARGIDTTKGSRAAAIGYGSSGHGEQGTSRYLYDYRDITHPLSSYENNDKNLRGYYRSCTDHINRQVTIVMEPEFPDPPYDLGETEIQILINKNSDYSTYKAAEYDETVLVDHTINAGNTFATNDEWDGLPTGQSVTDRLFTGLGAKPTNPVLFLGVSAGNLPGGSMESRDKVVPPVPSRTTLSGPDNGENYNADKLVDTVSKSTHGTTGKTYVYTLYNRGEADSIVSLGVSYQRQQGPYKPPNPPDQVNAIGDKIADWSFAIKAPYTPGDPDFPSNTIKLSGGETVTFEHTVKPTTDVPTGYIIKQTVTIEESSGKVINKQLTFDVDVTS